MFSDFSENDVSFKDSGQLARSMGWTRRPEHVSDKCDRTLPSTRPMGELGGQQRVEDVRPDPRPVRALPARRVLQLTASAFDTRAAHLHGQSTPRLQFQRTDARRQLERESHRTAARGLRFR